MKQRFAAVLLLVFLLSIFGPAYAAGSFSNTENEIMLTVGESAEITGENIDYLASSDETTAFIDGFTVTGMSEGSCTVTVFRKDGTKHNIRVYVNPPGVRRALVLGEADYAGEKYRTGSVNTTQGITDMLSSQKFGGTRFHTVMRMDSTRSDVFSLIADTFAEACEEDISLVYINCHGGVDDGIAYLRFHDNSRICAPELEKALRKIPGTIVLLLDCCQSGAILGDRAGAESFEKEFVRAFSAFGSGGLFRSGKYKVLASCRYCENSYRITTEKTVAETGMSTVFARAMCEGAGWDLIRDKVCTMKADANLDRKITLNDMFVYLRRRIPHYLREAGVAQEVQVYPEGDTFVLFSR